MWTDTPLPQEEPAGQNPPDGAIFDYYLSDKAVGETTLEIFDAAGKSVRKFSSNDKPYDIPAVNIPLYWIRPQEILSGDAGAHRFLWDLHYTAFEEAPQYPISAIYKNTEPSKNAPWVAPGIYTAKLTVNGKTITQSFAVKMDPRVKTSPADLQKIFSASMTCYEGRKAAKSIQAEITVARKMLKEKMDKAGPDLEQTKALDQELASLEGERRGRRAAASGSVSVGGVESGFAGLANILHETEMPATTQTLAAVKKTNDQLIELKNKWVAIKTKLVK
jgi:hypothetical protein